VIPKSKYPKSLAIEPLRPFQVLLLSVGMLTTIHLNNELSFEANKIDDVGADGRLPAELAIVYLPMSQFIPDALFRIGHVFPELSSECMIHFFACSILATPP
jgi:hypothetical protein